MSKTKITNHQFLSLAANGSIGGTVIVLPAILAGIAKQDAWISAFITSVFGILVMWIYWFLGSRYPGMTFVDIIKAIFGKWVGWIIAAGYVYLCLTISYHLPWYVSNFVKIQAMAETPSLVINLLFITAAVIALRYGIEVIARASELFIYFAVLIFFIAMILVLPNIKADNLLPVLEKGITPALKGSVILSCYLTFPLITLMMIYPINIDDIPKVKKSLIKGYLLGSSVVFTANIMSILVLGSKITASSQFPVYLLATEINVGVVFTRLEFFIAIVWIITLFTTDLLFFYAGMTGLSKLLGLKNNKSIIAPLGIIMLILSEIVFPDQIYQTNWVNYVWIPYIITFALVLPVLMLLVLFIKRQHR